MRKQALLTVTSLATVSECYPPCFPSLLGPPEEGTVADFVAVFVFSRPLMGFHRPCADFGADLPATLEHIVAVSLF